MSELPASPAAITPAWLTAALLEGGLASHPTVVGLDWELIGTESGFTGVVARLWPRYASEAGPASIVAKFPTAERPLPSGYRERQERDPITAWRHFERSAREIRFYREIAPVAPLPVPRLYFGAADEASGRVVLLLEDLTEARPGDALLGCMSADLALVLDAIAPFHATWWSRPDREGRSWLPRWGGDPLARQERYDRRAGPFLERFGDRLPSAVRELVERLRGRSNEVLTALHRAPATILHADLHLDNVLFTPSDPARPVVLLDWQGATLGPAAADVAHLLVGSLATDERRAAESDLLGRYHSRLLANGVSGYSFQRFRDDLRLALLNQWGIIVAWFADVDFGQYAGRERALVEAMLGDGRQVAALLDFDVAALLA